MEGNTINYSNLSNFALIRFGHQIGHGWYKILAKAEKELYKLGYSIELVERREGILCISTNQKNCELPSQVQNVLYEAEVASEMTCEWCGNYSVAQISIDKSLVTICEGCQEKSKGIDGIEKRLLTHKNLELERLNVQMRREMEQLKRQVEYYKMGCEHYKNQSQDLSKKLEKNDYRPKICVISSTEKDKNEKE